MRAGVPTAALAADMPAEHAVTQRREAAVRLPAVDTAAARHAAAIAAAAMLAAALVAAAVTAAAADADRVCDFPSKRPICFGRRAFFVVLWMNGCQSIFAPFHPCRKNTRKD
jgi:hypothetical protein